MSTPSSTQSTSTPEDYSSGDEQTLGHLTIAAGIVTSQQAQETLDSISNTLDAVSRALRSSREITRSLSPKKHRKNK
jgi:hypothetical protein